MMCVTFCFVCAAINQSTRIWINIRLLRHTRHFSFISYLSRHMEVCRNNVELVQVRFIHLAHISLHWHLTNESDQSDFFLNPPKSTNDLFHSWKNKNKPTKMLFVTCIAAKIRFWGLTMDLRMRMCTYSCLKEHSQRLCNSTLRIISSGEHISLLIQTSLIFWYKRHSG